MAGEGPLRVLVIVSNKHATWGKAWLTSEELFTVAFQIIKDYNLLNYTFDHYPQMQLLVKQRWETRVLLVFDISNTGYDPRKGHLPDQNRLPVAIVRLSQKEQAYLANFPIQSRVNNDISRAHNLNGINSLPPFVTDYTSGTPQYLEPRDPSLL